MHKLRYALTIPGFGGGAKPTPPPPPLAPPAPPSASTAKKVQAQKVAYNRAPSHGSASSNVRNVGGGRGLSLESTFRALKSLTGL